MINRFDYNGNKLSKYDAPLKIQFEKGVQSFKRGKINNPYHYKTMQHREWQRGFNFAYFINLKNVKKYETRRRGKALHAE